MRSLLRLSIIPLVATAGTPLPAAASQDSALAAVKKEPKVKDAAWAPNGFGLWVGVLDDGTRRDGYAGYICQVLVEHGAAKGALVKVMDIAPPRGEIRELGRMWCDDLGRRR